MRLVFLSDTHDAHDRLVVPRCDLLIHAGDVTRRGRREELERFEQMDDAITAADQVKYGIDGAVTEAVGAKASGEIAEDDMGLDLGALTGGAGNTMTGGFDAGFISPVENQPR